MSEHMHRLVRDMNSALRVRAATVAAATLAVVAIDLLVPALHIAPRLAGAATVLAGFFVSWL